jgi:hypothetical protein
MGAGRGERRVVRTGLDWRGRLKKDIGSRRGWGTQVCSRTKEKVGRAENEGLEDVDLTPSKIRHSLDAAQGV